MDYYWGHWSNTKCPDPKELYQAIIYKPEHVIKMIYFRYWAKSNETFYSSIHEFKDWYYQDYAMHGRCINLVPSHEHVQHGIKEIDLILHVNSTLIIYTPGMLQKVSPSFWSKSYLELGKWYQKRIHYKVYDILDYGGESCNNNNSYQLDDCNAMGVGIRCLETIGCTNPYTLSKTNIYALMQIMGKNVKASMTT